MALVYGKVVATVIEVRGDSSDAGSEPDVIGATSVKVNFQPQYTSFVSSLTRRIVNVKPIECSVDAAGNLLDPQGAVGIWLLVGEYTVSFTNSHHPNITIMVTEAHTDLTPLNLGDSVPYVPPSGTTVTTVILPGGAAEGQIVGWVGGQLAWVDPALGTDHGELAGLADDDHTQYALADGSRGSFAAPLGVDDNYVTDAEKSALHGHANKTALDAVTGVNTGDQTLPTWSTISGKPAVVAEGATQAAARSSIGAGTSSFSGAYADLSGKPTLGDAAAKNTGTTTGTVAAGDDSRITGAAQKASNLSDLTNAGTARTNLGLGTAATTAATAYATAAQGAKADTAVQPAALSSYATGTDLSTHASDTTAVHGIADTSAIVVTTDPRLSDARTPTAHQHPALDISDSTATGRSVVTAVDAAAARTAIGAGTSSLAIGTTGTTAAAGNRAASTTAIGMIEIATNTETTTGTDTTRAVTPSGVKAVSDTLVPNTRTVNTKALSADIVLTPADIGAAPALGVDDNYVTDLEKAALHGHSNKTALDAVSGTNTGDQTWTTLTGKPSTFPPEVHTQASSTITDLTEAVQDIVAAFVVAGTGMVVQYDDDANTYTLTATGTTGDTDPEIVRDVIGSALVASTGIQIVVNDAGDSITISSTAVLPTRQVISGTGLTGGGDLSADRTLAVSYGTTAGTAAVGNDSRIVNAVPNTRTVAGKALSSNITLAAADISDSTSTGRSLLTSADAATARGVIGAGTSNLVIGTAAGTAAEGNDSRIVNAVQSSRQVIAGTGLTGGGALTADRTLTVAYGTTSTTAAVGNDSRIVNAVPNTRTVNAKALSANITLTAADVGAATTAQGALADTAVQPAALASYVPTTRTVNSKALSTNITLTAADVGAAPTLGADDNYVTDAEKAALHGHSNKTALDAVTGTNTGDQSWPLPGTPATFPPSTHSHDDLYFTEAEVTTLLAGKSDTGHTHPEYAQKIHVGTTPPTDITMVWVDTSGL